MGFWRRTTLLIFVDLRVDLHGWEGVYLMAVAYTC